MEERLRELASEGDLDAVKALLAGNLVNVNSQNSTNGWTALHWACKRGHASIVLALQEHGADSSITNFQEQTAAQMTNDPTIHRILQVNGPVDVNSSQLPIQANYLAHPRFPYIRQNGDVASAPRLHVNMATSNVGSSISESELVLKARLANASETDSDFIEVELDRTSLTYDALMQLMCAELVVDRALVSKIRKLPNTIMRKDKDVKRLCDFQELELVLISKKSTRYGFHPPPTLPVVHNETILY